MAAPSSVEQRQEAVEKPMVLDQIAGHHAIGKRPREQFRHEAVLHGLRPGRLARAAKDFGEAFGHYAASR